MKAVSAALAFALTLSLAVSSVSAMCEVPQLVLVPESGAIVPPNPILYWFEPGHRREGVDEASAPITLSEPEAAGDFSVRRIQVRQARGRFHIRIGDRTFAYRIDSDWTVSTKLEVKGHSYTKFNWTCSHTDTVNLHVQSDARAFRVRWPSGSTIIHSRWFNSTNATRGWALHLGHLSCLGATVPGGSPPTDVQFTIAALYPDGSTEEVRARLPPRPPEPREPTPVGTAGTYVMGDPFGLTEPPNPAFWVAFALLALASRAILRSRRFA